MELRDFDESVRFLPNKSTTGLLGEARKAVAFKPYKERLQIARDHFLNALDYKAPRFNFLFQNSPLLFRIVYQVQTSHTWNIILILLSYIFMYLIIITHRKPQPLQQWLQFGLIAIFWLDVCMQIYHKSDKVLRQQSKFQTRFYIKILVLTLLTIDQILAMTLPNSQKFIRYFILLRCVLPVLYHSTLRKNMFALGAIYKDILVFTFFYAFVIVIFAMIANVQVQKPKNGQKYDELSQNYFSLDRALFLIYTLSSFQGFPDNQTKAIKAQPTIAIFFIVFILLNLFFFITIPSSILFKQFKDVRSKIILVGQIKQQSSLILAFACLCQPDLQIERNTFIQFLMVCFRNKPGYIDQITQIFMQIDQNRNNKVQITQFMQICKIINSHRSLYPPKFDDWQPWIQFRIYVNQRFGLKDFFLGIKYKIISSIFIVFAIVNCLLNIFCTWAIFQIIDLAVAIIFVVQLTLKLIAIGPQNYFKDPWNKLDFFISILIFTTQIIGFQDNDSNVDILLKLTRAYRIALLPQYLFDKRKIVSLSNFSVKISRLVTQMIMTISIVAEYFPIYLVFFYFFGVLGLQMFGNLTPQKTPEQSPYSVFNQVANFQSFVFTQFYMVQILVQGGWSMVSFDYAYRYPLPQVITMLFFVSAHFSITLVVSSLIKGITWQVYEKIEQQTNIEQSRKLKKLKQQKQIKQTKQILQTVRHQINLNQTLHLQNIISRQIYEQKADHEILKKMYQALSDQKNNFMVKKTQQNQRKNLIPLLIKDLNLFVDQIELFNNAQNKMQQISQILPNQRSVPYLLKQQQSLYQNQVNDLSQPNIDQQIQRLISKAIIDGKYSFTQNIIYPRLLTDFLQTKLKTLSQHNQQINIKNSTILQQQNKQKSQLFQQSYIIQSNFNITTDTFTKNTQSINFLTDSLKILLQMKISQKQLKDKIISRLIETHTINEQQALLLLSKKKAKKSRDIGPNLILRRTFLANINERLVQKFQIQYFSNLYGKAFKQISQNTIQPLLRLQSKLTYCLRNALRYRQMSQLNFFNIINTIEDQISSKLLSKGSLFKFVYQIDSLNQTWFTIEVVQKSQVKVHFIKNGVWIWNKKMKQKEIYVADDLFYWKDLQQQQLLFNININSNQSKQPSSLNKNKQYLCERFIKMLYQSFQTLALCLPTQKNFFTPPNPQSKQYSLYSVYNNTEQIERTCQITKRFSISKIMLVCLVNQGKRRNINNQQQQLKYQLTDLKQASSSSPQQPNKKYNFNINSTRKQALQKLQQFQTVQQEQISDQQKLPHAYIINLLQQVRAILQLGTPNFVYHIENLLNRNNNKDICIYNSYGNNTIKNTYLQRKNSLLYNKHINSHPNLNIHNNNNSMNNLNININLNRNRSNSNQNINNNNIINTSRSNSKNQYMTRQTSIIPNIQIQYSQSLSDNNSVYI